MKLMQLSMLRSDVMEKFYKDSRDIDEINKSYAGKAMSDIVKAERAHFENELPKIDEAHSKFIDADRSKMLTVGKLIDWLKTQDPDACILAFETNSNAYIEQTPDLPNYDICTVKQAKEEHRKSLEAWYKNDPDASAASAIIQNEIDTVFRYAKDSDVIIKFN